MESVSKITTVKSSFKKELKKSLLGFLFISPVMIGILIFCAVPIVQSFIYSFYEYDAMEKFIFNGLNNYKFLFTADWAGVGKSVSVTIIYTVISIPVNLVLSYILALLLNRNGKGTYLFRVLIYIPVVIPPIASGILWKDIFNSNNGIFNQILNIVGLPSSMWLDSADTALMTMIIMGLWGLGGGMILWLAAFKNIPQTMFEAVELDGANALQKVFYITIPMSTPIIFYNLLTGIIGSLQAFGSFIMTTDGRGPNDSLYFYCVRIYNEAFVNFNMGYACALAWVMFAVIILITLLMFKTSKWVFYN